MITGTAAAGALYPGVVPAQADTGAGVGIAADGAYLRSANQPSLNANGRFVVFQSDADDLVPGDTNAGVDVFVRDTSTARTERVSVSSSGEQAMTGTVWAARADPDAISGNGRWVVFTSPAGNLTPPDTNDSGDVFVRDRWTHTTRRVSVGPGGIQADGESRSPRISGNGRYVLFQSWATNLIAGRSYTSGLYIHDLWTGLNRRVDVDPAGGPANSWLIEDTAITTDGRYVLFVSQATNLVPGDTNDRPDVFLRDLRRRVTERVNVSSSGEQANAADQAPAPTPDFYRIAAVSGDGRYVAFSSQATNLGGAAQDNLPNNLYLRDRWNHRTVRLIDGENGFIFDPTLSTNGSTLLFAAPRTMRRPQPAPGSRDSRYVAYAIGHGYLTWIPEPPGSAPTVAGTGRSISPQARGPLLGPTPPAIDADADRIAYVAGGVYLNNRSDDSVLPVSLPNDATQASP
jgi:hypothetical protein